MANTARPRTARPANAIGSTDPADLPSSGKTYNDVFEDCTGAELDQISKFFSTPIGELTVLHRVKFLIGMVWANRVHNGETKLSIAEVNRTMKMKELNAYFIEDEEVDDDDPDTDAGKDD